MPEQGAEESGAATSYQEASHNLNLGTQDSEMTVAILTPAIDQSFPKDGDGNSSNNNLLQNETMAQKPTEGTTRNTEAQQQDMRLQEDQPQIGPVATKVMEELKAHMEIE